MELIMQRLPAAYVSPKEAEPWLAGVSQYPLEYSCSMVQ
jgi:hypothetical protein